MNASEQAVMSVFKPGALLTARQIHDLAPDAKRVLYTLERLQYQGVLRVAGLRHSIDRGSEIIYSPVETDEKE